MLPVCYGIWLVVAKMIYCYELRVRRSMDIHGRGPGDGACLVIHAHVRVPQQLLSNGLPMLDSESI
jgi:hypothetical protein